MNSQHSHRPMSAPSIRPPAPLSKKSKKRPFFVIFLILLAGSIFAAGYFYRQYKKALENPKMATQNEIKNITTQIEEFMDLPKDEEPTLATITDSKKLKEQVFFSNAQNGDKVLIYAKSGKAILWRPSAKRVIEVTSLFSGGAGNSAPGADQPQQGQ